MGGFVGGLFGNQSAPSQAGSQIYQPTGTAQQDQNLQGLLNQNTNLVSGGNNPYSQLSPQMLQAFTSLFSSPQANGLQSAAGQSGQQSSTIGQQATAQAAPLGAAGASLLPYAQQVMQLGLDPQNALYNQQYQQQQDQSNVTNAQYGLTGQQAAGNTQQAGTNFNIDWQNNELTRALVGLTGGASAIGQAGGTEMQAGQLGAGGAANTLLGGATPYAASQQIGQGQESALSQYLAQLLGPVTSSQSTIGDLGNYLGQGIGASASQANAALQDYAQQQSDIGSLFSGLGSIAGFQPGGENTSTLAGLGLAAL